jgi:hypothetical protein
LIPFSKASPDKQCSTLWPIRKFYEEKKFHNINSRGLRYVIFFRSYFMAERSYDSSLHNA